MEVGVRELTILSDRLSYSLVPPEKVSFGGSIILYQWLLCRKDGSNETRWKYLEELGISEMERDCMIAHGNSRFIKERLFEMSDPFTVVICDKCGMLASSMEECVPCKTDKMSRVNLPYATKLVQSELMAMSIKMEIEAEK